MSLGIGDLKRKAKGGDVAAQKVLPLRTKSHLVLASILLTNVGVISATSLVLDNHLNGLVAGILSTLLIVVFGEVLPQAWFARNALMLCSIFAPALKLMIILTYPVSKPLQLLLDKMFGHESSQLHTRNELTILIAEHLDERGSELDEDEVEIMKGALSLSQKRVREIMTDINHVYWVTPQTMLDEAKIDEIKERSWSRIPVFDMDKTTCHGVLLMKDLLDIDFDGEPRHVSEVLVRPTKIVGSMTALDTLFRKFIGARSHLMPVERDDQIVGIVTIEDLIEEIIGHEIEDESH